MAGVWTLGVLLRKDVSRCREKLDFKERKRKRVGPARQPAGQTCPACCILRNALPHSRKLLILSPNVFLCRALILRFEESNLQQIYNFLLGERLALDSEVRIVCLIMLV